MQGSREHRPGEPDHDASAPSIAVRHPEKPTPRLTRLKTRADFLRAARGQRAHSRSLSLQIFKRADLNGNASEVRFGLTVTKKVGGAVERNRIKRRLRDALRSPDLAPTAGHDYVIVARRDALTIPFSRLVADLSRTLTQSRHAAPMRRGGRKEPNGQAQDVKEPISPP